MTKEKGYVIDIDDTLLSFVSHLKFVSDQLKDTNFMQTELSEWLLPLALKETFEEFEDLIYASLPANVRVREKLEEMRCKGYKIILMTARDEKFRRVTLFNLGINRIKYDAIFFNKNKSLKINRLEEKYEIVGFADDKASTVNKVKRDTNVKNVYLINMSSNRDETLEDGVKRINNLNEIIVEGE